MSTANYCKQRCGRQTGLSHLLLSEAKDALDNVERFVARVESASTRKPKSA